MRRAARRRGGPLRSTRAAGRARHSAGAWRWRPLPKTFCSANICA